jgi:hypothetical protein
MQKRPDLKIPAFTFACFGPCDSFARTYYPTRDRRFARAGAATFSLSQCFSGKDAQHPNQHQGGAKEDVCNCIVSGSLLLLQPLF